MLFLYTSLGKQKYHHTEIARIIRTEVKKKMENETAADIS